MILARIQHETYDYQGIAVWDIANWSCAEAGSDEEDF